MRLLICATTMLTVVCALSNPRCERIEAPLCQELGYNVTRMPNFVGHVSQTEAILGLNEFAPLLRHKCSPFIRLFVCSVYIPLCSEQVPEAVPACRGLCEEVREDCLPALRAHGLDWPSQLNCSRFPEPPDLCMQQPPEDELPGHAPGNELIPLHHLQEQKIGGEVRVHRCPPNTVLVGYECMKLCGSNVKYGEQERIVLEIWIATWSMATMAVVIFALLTFVIQPKRFRWPARPILYLTSCGFVMCLVYFVRWLIGSLTCSGDAAFSKPFESWLCVSTALLMTFCDFAYCLWWCTFSYVWYLSAAKEWSTEAIERISARIHSIVWSLSVVPIVYALVSNSIRLNAFTGFCEVVSHTLTAAQVVIVGAGIVLAVFTSVALKDVRKALVRAGRSPFKLERLIYRLGVVSLGVSAPFCASLVCYYFDGLHIELLRIGARFVSVLFAASWVISYKTFSGWEKALRPAFLTVSYKTVRRWNKALWPAFTQKVASVPVTKV